MALTAPFYVRASMLSAFGLGLLAGCGSSDNNTADAATALDSGTPGVDSGAPVSDNGTPATDNGTPSTGFRCTTGRLFAGNPLFDPSNPVDDPTPTGVPLLDRTALANAATARTVAPVDQHSIAFIGNTLVTNTQGALWTVDLSAPAASQRIRRVFGGDAGGPYTLGACASARWGITQEMSLMADGSLVLADINANAVLRITDPLGAGCSVSAIAGTSMPIDDLAPYLNQSMFERLPSFGDQDGPAATAKINVPRFPVGLSTGDVVFFDNDNGKWKRIANDAAHTVSTLAELMPYMGGDAIPIGQVVINDRVYMLVDTSLGYTGVYELNPTASPAAVRAVYFGTNEDGAWGNSSHGTSTGSAITTDGTRLIVYNRGEVFTLATTGGPPVKIAGAPLPVDFPPNGYDVLGEHPAMGTNAILLPNAPGDRLARGSRAFMAWRNGVLYVGGTVTHGGGHGYYISSVDCR